MQLTVVTQMAIEDGSEHKRLVQEIIYAFFVGFNSNDAILCE